MRKALRLLLAVAVLGGCKKDPPPPVAPVVVAPVANNAGAQLEDRCVDDWLAAKKLDSYGNAYGTMYAGGSPLFDEASGTTKDRLTFVYEKHPDAKTACEGAPAPRP